MFRKLLKTKLFILEKFLDTGFRPLIRFLPESSDGFLNFRWNYSPLKKGRPELPDGLLLLEQSAFSHDSTHGGTETRRKTKAEFFRLGILRASVSTFPMVDESALIPGDPR